MQNNKQIQFEQSIIIKELTDEIEALESQLKFSTNDVILIDEKEHLSPSIGYIPAAHQRFKTLKVGSAMYASEMTEYSSAVSDNYDSVVSFTDTYSIEEEEYGSVLAEKEEKYLLLIAKKDKECKEQLSKVMSLKDENRILYDTNKKLQARLD
eukprot:304666_1